MTKQEKIEFLKEYVKLRAPTLKSDFSGLWLVPNGIATIKQIEEYEKSLEIKDEEDMQKMKAKIEAMRQESEA